MQKGWFFGIAALCLLACGNTDQKSVASVNASCAPAEALSESVKIAAGTYTLGDDAFYWEEGPVHTIDVAAFEIDAYEVTNRQFAAFIAATNYKTRAERGLSEPEFENLPDEMRRPGSAVFIPPRANAPTTLMSWWRFVDGAHWRAPAGPGTTINGMDDHPVVHVAYEDARAYAQWRGRRLPTEAEWEVAARGGLTRAPYAWGQTPPDQLQTPAANTWQGLFPIFNEQVDGYSGLAPVGCFQPNGLGLYDMVGNVWEWTQDSYTARRDQKVLEGSQDQGTIKGGSFLCADNYCRRYRPAARQPQERLLSTSHIGFRTVRTITEQE